MFLLLAQECDLSRFALWFHLADSKIVQWYLIHVIHSPVIFGAEIASKVLRHLL